ncbi:MAG: putative oxidoreductase [Candidatus Eremiobacteraeota bacterium]|nr:putative oxidoreductase [Candidatus Eremiobacteraeota bacterium]
MQTLIAPESSGSKKTLGTVIVTGGASGLGAAIADAVARHGGMPVTFDIAQPRAAREYDHHIVDVADRGAVERAIRTVAERNGGVLDAIVANAGMDACGDFDTVDADAWERVIHVNLIGTASLVRAALPYLEKASNPRIVNVASTLGLRVLGAATAYSASKFGVVGLTRGLALDLAGRVGVTLLVPGGMNTHFFDGRDEQFKPAADAFEKNQLNDPSNVAEAVVFALSQPKGCEVRELIITPSRETSWP